MGQQVTAELSIVELQRIVQANGGYERAGDAEMAYLYAEAGEAILNLGIVESEHNGERIRIDLSYLKTQVAQARQWLAVRSSSASARLPVYQPATNWRCE